jgi:hypothetical protein
MAWTSENKYMLSGNIATGLTLDSSNPNAGTPLAGTPLYGSGTYGSQKFQYAAFYDGVYESDYYNNKLTISTTGDSGDITYTYSISDDGVTYTAFPTAINIVGTTVLYMRAKYFKIRFYFHSTFWGDSDSIAITAIAAHFTTFAAGTIVDANEMNGNFSYVGNGHWLPMGGNSLENTNGSYNIGSVDYRWKTLYADEIRLMQGGGISRSISGRYYLQLSTATQAIEITGLNGESNLFNELIFRTVHGAAHSSSVYLYINSDSVATCMFRYAEHVGGTQSTAVTLTAGVPIYTSHSAGTGQIGLFEMQFIYVNGYKNIFHGTRCDDVSGTNVYNQVYFGGYYTIATATLTSLKIIAPTASALGAGTVVELFQSVF